MNHRVRFHFGDQRVGFGDELDHLADAGNIIEYFVARKIAGQNAAAMVANLNSPTLGARSPRECTHGKVGTAADEMKHKRAEAKAAKQQRHDRHYKNPSRTSMGMRQPRTSETPIAIANEPARNWANLRGGGAEPRVIPLECAKLPCLCLKTIDPPGIFAAYNTRYLRRQCIDELAC
jgi:hypothetical protein